MLYLRSQDREDPQASFTFMIGVDVASILLPCKDQLMLQMKNITWLNWVVSMLMFFSIGCLFGASYPNADDQIMIWVGVLFVSACTKVWLHHQSGKIDKS